MLNFVVLFFSINCNFVVVIKITHSLCPTGKTACGSELQKPAISAEFHKKLFVEFNAEDVLQV